MIQISKNRPKARPDNGQAVKPARSACLVNNPSAGCRISFQAGNAWQAGILCYFGGKIPTVRPMDIAQISSIFPGLEAALYTEIEKTATAKKIDAGTILLRKGQTIRSAMLVLEGVIKLFQEDEDGDEFFMYHLNPGEACAVSMLCTYRQETSNVFATALTDATILLIPLTAMDKWMAEYKSWQYFVIQSYRSLYSELLNTINEIAFRNMDERLEFYIRKQVKQFGSQVRLTHQEIANDLNSSREVISRLMKKMEKNGWLTLHRNSFEWLKK